jgi:nicotinamidase/pyrazinamidase
MKALLLVDIQNDFLPGGPLAVPQGDQVVAIANAMMKQFDLVAASKDWHPADHGSFAANHAGKQVGELIQLNGLPQILWPTHCVAGTSGAQLAPGLDVSKINLVIHKGTDKTVDSYSAFYDNGKRKSTGLTQKLKALGIDELHIMGLATDYCVKFTALDAVKEGFKTVLILEGCRGVNLKAGDVEQAVNEMRNAGVEIVQSVDLR